MATILPKIRVKRGYSVGNDVWVGFPDLTDYPKTFLSADEAAAQTTLSVIDTGSFASTGFILLGNVGEQEAEIVAYSATTSSTITSSATTYAHVRGTEVHFMPYNQVVILDDTDSAFGSPTTTTISLLPNLRETYKNYPSGTSADYYKARFKNSTGTTYSSYSDSVVATGYDDNSVFSIKKRALDSVGHKIGDMDWLTDEWLNQALWEGRRELESNLDHWSFRKKFNENVTDVIPGQYIITPPSDLKEPKTAKNILAIRIGKDGTPLVCVTKQEMNQKYEGVAHTTLASDALTADVTLTITDSGDFEDSGTVDVGGTLAGVDSVTYTANDETTGILSGVTGIQAAGHTAGVDVWQGASFGYPQCFTVTEDGIQFDQPFDDDYADENIFMDYWGTLVATDSDADEVEEPDYDMFVNYLSYRVKKRKAKGELSLEDDDYKQWIIRSQRLIVRERTEQTVQFVPDTSAVDSDNL